MRGGPKVLGPRKEDPGPWKIGIVGVGMVELGIGRMRVVGMRVVGMGGGGVGVVGVGVLGGWNYWNGTCWHWNYEVAGMGVAEVGGIGMGIVGADLSERELREFYGCSSSIFAGEGSLQGIRLWEY